MAAPKRRTSKKVTRQRRTHKKLYIPNMVECTNCGELTRSHHICKSCGYYDGEEVISK